MHIYLQVVPVITDLIEIIILNRIISIYIFIYSSTNYKLNKRGKIILQEQINSELTKPNVITMNITSLCMI